MVREISGGDLGRSYFYKPPDLLSYIYMYIGLSNQFIYDSTQS